MDDAEPPLRRGHRFAREAQQAESNRSWTTAMYKHEEAVKCFTECLGLTAHPSANRAILLLISKHTKKYESIRDRIANNKSIKNILFQNGFINKNNQIIVSNNNNCININKNTFNKLRNQMQQIVSYSQQIILNPLKNNKNNKKQINQYLKGCDVRQSISINKNDNDKIINEKVININDNFFNPHHNYNHMHSNEQLISSNKILTERVKLLESKLKSQTNEFNEYQNEIQNKVKLLRQEFDNLYSLNVNHNNNDNNDNNNNNDNSKDNLNDNNSKLDNGVSNSQINELLDVKLKDLRVRYEKDKERLKRINALAVKELKQKIKNWINYAEKLKKENKILKKQIQLRQQKNNKNKKLNSNISNNKSIIQSSHNRNIYPRGTLNRVKQNAIPEQQENT